MHKRRIEKLWELSNRTTDAYKIKNQHSPSPGDYNLANFDKYNKTQITFPKVSIHNSRK